MSTATIHKVLTQAQVKPLKKTRRTRKGKRSYQKDIPGERVQMDVGKIAPKLYQYTAIDDCSRLKVIKLYFNQQAASTLDFLDQIVAEFPFPIQRIQTERGEEFYDLIDLKAPDLFEQLQQWQDYYKRDREHGSINQTPWQKWEALKAQIPTLEEVQRIYGLKKERIRDADYRVDRGKPRRVILL